MQKSRMACACTQAVNDIVHTSLCLWQTRAGPEGAIGLDHESPSDRHRRLDRSASMTRTLWHCG